MLKASSSSHLMVVDSVSSALCDSQSPNNSSDIHSFGSEDNDDAMTDDSKPNDEHDDAMTLDQYQEEVRNESLTKKSAHIVVVPKRRGGLIWKTIEPRLILVLILLVSSWPDLWVVSSFYLLVPSLSTGFS